MSMRGDLRMKPINKFHPGDTAFLIESNRIIREVKVLKFSGGFYTIRYIESPTGIKVKGHRLFAVMEEAEASMPKKATKRA